MNQLVKLNSIDCSLTQIDDDTLKAFSKFNNLKSLDLSNTKVSGVGLIRNPRLLRKLRRLDISAMNDFGDDELLKLLPKLTNLEQLIIRDTSISTDGLSLILQNLSLTELDIRGCPVDLFGDEYLQKRHKGDQLKLLVDARIAKNMSEKIKFFPPIKTGLESFGVGRVKTGGGWIDLIFTSPNELPYSVPFRDSD